MTENPYRLPRTAVPSRYEVRLEPDLDQASFGGSCATTIELTEASNRVVCNAADLTVHEAWVEHVESGTRIDADAILPEADAERLVVELSALAEPGTYVFHTRFVGVLNDKLCGFYRSTFTDTDGNEQVLATTQMEATDCRRAFPCWDEPDFKAVFAVTLVVPDDLLALSNAAEVSRTPVADTGDTGSLSAGKVEVRFADTMVMSTYLVAFVVGPLEISEAVDVDGTPLRVAYPRGRGHLSGFALEIGAFALRYFADYYGIPYPGDKLDLVAIPDFAFGAMENLGCVTFRETALLVDPTAVPQAELQRVTDVVAHELAHMWFGDLVTMKWWNGIWLNEAFATFMEMLATDAFRPEWDRWTDFGLSRTAAFDVDALSSTRPIEYEVVSPADAEGMFDILTYEKGAAVVRMLEQYLGSDVFRLGIRRYLSQHAYGNTETTDLWDALEAESGEPVREMMEGWIFQGGFPLVRAELIRNDLTGSEGESTLRLTQSRFRYAGEPEIEPDAGVETEGTDAAGTGGEGTGGGHSEPSWSVPVLATLSTRPEADAEPVTNVQRLLLGPNGVEVPILGNVDWVVVNTEGTGFYRVSYSAELLEALTTHAQSNLSPIERYGLVDDAVAALLAGERSAPDLLTFLESFADETDLSVWQRITGALSFLDRILEGDGRGEHHADIRKVFQARVQAFVSPAYQRLGPDPRPDDTDRTRELRASLLECLAVLGNDPAAELRARELFDAAGSPDGPPVDPSLAAAATWIVASIGGEDEFATYLDRYRTASSPQEEVRYLQAMADFDDDELLGRVLAMSLTDEVRTQNAPYLIRRCLTNRNYGDRAWLFVQANWDTINERFPSNSISRLLEGIRSLHDPVTATGVFSFFETHEVPQGDKILAQHLERLAVNLATRRREGPALAAVLT